MKTLNEIKDLFLKDIILTKENKEEINLSLNNLINNTKDLQITLEDINTKLKEKKDYYTKEVSFYSNKKKEWNNKTNIFKDICKNLFTQNNLTKFENPNSSITLATKTDLVIKESKILEPYIETINKVKEQFPEYINIDISINKNKLKEYLSLYPIMASNMIDVATYTEDKYIIFKKKRNHNLT